MHERFDDSSRAVSYVASGMRSDFPDSTLEVLLERRGHTSQFICRPFQLTHILLDCCKRFPMATVYYDSDNRDGHIAEIRCHCLGEKAPSCCRYNHPRSRVLVNILKETSPALEAARQATGAGSRDPAG